MRARSPAGRDAAFSTGSVLSAGHESAALKLGMRATVLTADLAVYFTAAAAFAARAYQARGAHLQLWLWATLLLQPALLLVDHGHFQYANRLAPPASPSPRLRHCPTACCRRCRAVVRSSGRGASARFARACGPTGPLLRAVAGTTA